MPTRERLVQVGARRGEAIQYELGTELHEARTAAGLTLAALAGAVGITRQYLARIERGSARDVPLALYARLFAVLGMRLGARAYPAAPPLRDAGHVALLRRLRATLPIAARMHTEVPIVGEPVGRAWDAQVRMGQWYLNVEAETRIRDVQAMDRRIALKQSSDATTPILLLVADTKTNRLALRAAGPLLTGRFPLDARPMLRALRAGRCPPASGIVLL